MRRRPLFNVNQYHVLLGRFLHHPKQIRQQQEQQEQQRAAAAAVAAGSERLLLKKGKRSKERKLEGKKSL